MGTLIKAIAHYTKRHIVSVPLSRIKTNQELMDVMFDQSATVVNTQRTHEDDSSELPVLLDFKSVIFVMEDVDAASKVVQRRDGKTGAVAGYHPGPTLVVAGYHPAPGGWLSPPPHPGRHHDPEGKGGSRLEPGVAEQHANAPGIAHVE